eukprot:13537581-Alexandrium_andersonii.AAC.1
MLREAQSLFDSVFSDIEQQPPMPYIICGDFNTDLKCIHALDARMACGAIHDVAGLECFTNEQE